MCIYRECKKTLRHFTSIQCDIRSILLTAFKRVPCECKRRYPSHYITVALRLVRQLTRSHFIWMETSRRTLIWNIDQESWNRVSFSFPSNQFKLELLFHLICGCTRNQSRNLISMKGELHLQIHLMWLLEFERIYILFNCRLVNKLWEVSKQHFSFEKKKTIL